jgi:hypothetical protein
MSPWRDAAIGLNFQVGKPLPARPGRCGGPGKAGLFARGRRSAQGTRLDVSRSPDCHNRGLLLTA